MRGYLGEFNVELSDTPFGSFKPFDWAMYFIESYGQIDGTHHKDWVMDQVARIYCGTEVIVKLAKWDNGTCEFRVSLGEPSVNYKQWLEPQNEWGYSQGIAP